ncbi:hypothetical protein B4N89_46475 [Embleya scabrispora]|uniref:VCBS repeat-containing protein n=1 Tax=Embleya scabrispora TaxID=159449 RepID=A0A1T3NI60_9ACTN|nr:FG-GAP-like repeat-containing protein [Embleya scabrispora]OPC76483.1 hypothetical protein B4N89_46475 [Embleya scabrispora]
MLDFTVTDQVAARVGTPSVILAVQGNETKVDSNNGFKRISREPADTVISINYNTPPDPPTNLRSDPAPINGAASGNCGYIGRLNPDVGRLRLMADRNDPDGDDGELWFALNEMSAGGVEIWNSGWTSWGPNGATGMADVPLDRLTPGSTYRWSIRARDGRRDSEWTHGCTFSVDGTVPAVGEVSSTDFPRNGGGKTADNTGTFHVTATDPDSGVGRVEFALNSTLPVGEASPAVWDEVTSKWRIPDLPITRWGANTLLVRAVDRAGNRSQPLVYEFYAPGNPNATTTLGDITGDTRVDMLATTDGGDLKMYDAGTDPATGGRLVSLAAQGPKTSASGQPTWTGALLAHRGGAGITHDDLFVHDGTNLYVYRNSDGYTALPKPGAPNNGGQYYVSQNRVLAGRPFLCVDARTGQDCAPGIYADDWGRVKQIVAPGDVDGDGALDLITVEGDTNRLFLHSGNGTPGGFDLTAKLLGNTDWADRDIIAPGDVTGDERPDLWVRDRTTGNLYQYPSSVTTTGGIKITDPAAVADDGRRVPIATDLTTAAYPLLHTDGDLDGDKNADLWAEGPGGSLYVIKGNPQGTEPRFAPAQPLANSNTPWTTCEKFSSAGDTNVKLDLCGPILAKYKATGGPTGPLRLPTVGTAADSDGIGRYADFQAVGGGATNASIHWSPTTGAWSVQGNIRNTWLTGGGTHGPLGYPVGDEDTVRDGAGTTIGWISRFAGTATTGAGAVTWTPYTGPAHPITGETYNRWQATGGPRGPLGFPTTDITDTPTKPGAYTHFRTPGTSADNGSVYTTPGAGAHAVWGNIRNRWAELGWEQGYLGFPTSDEYDVTGGRRSDFQGGYVRWNNITGATVDHLPGDTTRDRRNEYSGDFDGDGRADVLTVYDYGQSTSAFFVSAGNADGTFGAPRQVWASLAGHWDTTRVKYTIGDFDGDGRDDIAALHVWNDGSTSLFKFIAHPGGVFSEPIPGYVTPAGNWDWNRAMVMAGDFNGDGKDDVAMLYAKVADPANGTTSVHTWVVRSDGTFDTPLPGWQSAPGGWNAASAKYTVGDYNGDGRADIAALYGWSDGSVTLHTLLAGPDGALAAPVQSWRAAPGTWDWNKTQLTTGDYNGDHRVEIGAMYDLGAGTAEYRVFPTTATGGFTNPVVAWHSAPGTWDTGSAYPLAGDVNGDGRTDISAMYEWNDGSTTLNTLSAKTDGTLNPPVQAWRAAPGTW